MSVRQKPFAKDSPTDQFNNNYSPKIRQGVSSRKKHSPNFRQCLISSKTFRQRFANVSVSLRPSAKDSPTCEFAKNCSPNIRELVSSPKTIRQGLPNVSARQKPFGKDFPTCRFAKTHSARNRQRQFGKDHSQNIHQRFAIVSLRQNHSPKIHQDSPTGHFEKTIRERCANVSVRQRPFAIDSATCQLAKDHSPKIRQRVSSPRTICQSFVNVSLSQGQFAKNSPTCQFTKDHSQKISQRVTWPRTIRQRFANVSVIQG